jgi:hypothetical protein
MPETVTQQRIAAAHAVLRNCNIHLSSDEIRAVLKAADAAAWQPIATCPADTFIDVWIPDGGIAVAFHTAGARAADVGATHWAWPRPAPIS